MHAPWHQRHIDIHGCRWTDIPIQVHVEDMEEPIAPCLVSVAADRIEKVRHDNVGSDNGVASPFRTEVDDALLSVSCREEGRGRGRLTPGNLVNTSCPSILHEAVLTNLLPASIRNNVDLPAITSANDYARHTHGETHRRSPR